MAHVWVEAFITGTWWVHIDPSGLARNAGEVWGRPRSRDWLSRFRLLIDSLDHSWNRTVITYDLERQVEAARSIGRRLQGLDAGALLKTVLPAILVLAGSIGILLVARRRHLFMSREERLLRAFYRRMERDCGIRPEPGRQGLFEIAAAAGDNGRVQEFVAIFAGAVYRDRRLTPGERTRLRRLLREGF
jgi:hypothetical protein